MLRSPLFNDFLTLRNSIDQLAEGVFGGDNYRTLWSRAGTGNGNSVYPMPLDVYATDDQAVIVAAVPGMHPDDLDLTIQQNTVTLSGSVRSVTDSEEAKGATWYIHELASGTWRRSVTLPFQVDADQAEATFEHGILRVVLPKAENARPKKIAISGSQHEAIGTGASS
ncbi:MAG TPA: Hsp20/alpha crystallin family protein [Thermomicrobiales bacterium]|nr:Hsp20/alpha crystallin family protein [Thermomicrobiales bacterium]